MDEQTNLSVTPIQQHVDNAVKIETQFSKKMDVVKDIVLDNAAKEDQAFIKTVRENVKEAAVKLTEVEKKKADYQEQQVNFESQKLTTEQKKNTHVQDENFWENRAKRRQYHFDGVKPIMEFFGINEPMNLLFLYILASLLSPLFLIAKLVKGTFGTLIAGAANEDRGKVAKGFLWTITCVFAVIVIICLVYLFLKWQGLDILAKIR